jgi:hypothetical protein
VPGRAPKADDEPGELEPLLPEEDGLDGVREPPNGDELPEEGEEPPPPGRAPKADDEPGELEPPLPVPP